MLRLLKSLTSCRCQVVFWSMLEYLWLFMESTQATRLPCFSCLELRHADAVLAIQADYVYVVRLAVDNTGSVSTRSLWCHRSWVYYPELMLRSCCSWWSIHQHVQALLLTACIWVVYSCSWLLHVGFASWICMCSIIPRLLCSNTRGNARNLLLVAGRSCMFCYSFDVVSRMSVVLSMMFRPPRHLAGVVS